MAVVCYCFGQCLQAAWFWFIILLCDSFVTIEGSQIIAFLAHHLLALPLRLYDQHLFPRLSHTAPIIIIDCFYIALFMLSSRLTAQMSHIISDSDGDCNLSFFLKLFFSAIWLLHGWCHMKILPSRRKFCVHHTTLHQFTASLHSKPHR